MSSNQLKSDWGFHTPVPDVVIELLPKIGTEGLALFTYFMYRVYSNRRKAGDYTLFPSWETIERDTGMSRRKIGRGMAALENAGLLVRRKRFGKSTIYTLTPSVKEVEPTAEEEVAPERNETVPSSLNVREQSPQSEGAVPSERGSNQEQINQEQHNREKDVVALLHERKVSRTVSKQLSRDFDAREIKRQIGFYDWRIRKGEKIRPGLLIQSIRNHWDPPRGYCENDVSKEVLKARKWQWVAAGYEPGAFDPNHPMFAS
jgi:hypothetical protein